MRRMIRSTLAPSGTLVAGVNFGNPVIAQKDPGGGEPRGVGPSLARELARRLGVPIRYATYDTAGRMADAAGQGAWDVAFLAVDPDRARDIAFTAPYVLIEGTCLVREDSPLRQVEEVDRDGLRVSVAGQSAYHLHLMRHVRHARLVGFATSQGAIEALLAGQVDVAAGVRQALAKAAREHGGLRVLEGAFMTIPQAAGVPRARADAAQSLHDFIEEAKASGFVARALADSGVRDATVAPAAAK